LRTIPRRCHVKLRRPWLDDGTLGASNRSLWKHLPVSMQVGSAGSGGLCARSRRMCGRYLTTAPEAVRRLDRRQPERLIGHSEPIDIREISHRLPRPALRAVKLPACRHAALRMRPYHRLIDRRWIIFSQDAHPNPMCSVAWGACVRQLTAQRLITPHIAV
jgi:hypothetical protein